MEVVSRSHTRLRRELKGHLPRLPPELYRGGAYVHWTLTMNHRATGWLTAGFHHAWQLVLLHACTRYRLLCPAYVLMPDHVHLLWIGLGTPECDQRVALAFLRRHLRPHLTPARWQHQAHDHVLREKEREHGAFQAVAHYLRENSVRAHLVDRWEEYPFHGCCIPGYPDLDPRKENYWELFWRIHHRLRAG